MESIFLTMEDTCHFIQEVYTPDIMKLLLKEVNQTEIPLLLYRDLEKQRTLTQHVRTVFSTWDMPPLSEQEIDKYFPELEAVFYAAGSVQKFARPFLRKGIKVISAWAANAVPVAEFSAAQILLGNKGWHYNQNALSFKSWKKKQETLQSCFPGNFRTKTGLLGCGMIGKKVIELLQAYELDLWVFDPFLSKEEADRLGVKKAEMADIFTHCHTISNHLADNEQTKGILNSSLFGRMTPYGVFINTGRGRQVVEKDLCEALQKEPGRTAVIDVTYPEPPEENSPLYTLPNAYLTTHMAGSIQGEFSRMAQIVFNEFKALGNNRPLKYSVTEKMLETMA